MAGSNRITPLLAPYLSNPPPTSLVLLTSVLGASTNWLVLRFIFAGLSNEAIERSRRSEGSNEHEDDLSVVLVSFLRDWDFWREGGRRLVGAGIWMISKKTFQSNKPGGVGT